MDAAYVIPYQKDKNSSCLFPKRGSVSLHLDWRKDKNYGAFEVILPLKHRKWPDICYIVIMFPFV